MFFDTSSRVVSHAAGSSWYSVVFS